MPLPVTSGLVVHFDAGTIAQADNTAVASWTPAAGSETAAAAQATSGQRPTYRTNRINSLPAVVFTAAGSSNLDTGAWGVSQPVPNTAFVVGKMTSGATAGVAGNYFSGRTGVFNYMGQEADQVRIGAGAAGELALAHVVDTNFHVYAAEYNSASSAIYLDSATAGATGTTGSAASSNMPGMRIGSTSGGTANYPDADIAEIIFYDRTLSATEISQVLTYLSNKYALAVTGIAAPSAGHASGTGAASAATANVSPAAGNAAGAGAAQAPAVSVLVNAGHASGTGAAQAPVVTVGAPTGHASGTGAANAVAPAVGVSATHASGVGAAQAPTVAVSPVAGLASGAGTAADPAATVGAAAGHAAGTGATSAPTVTSSAPGNVTAGHASGVGAALNPTVTVVSTSSESSESGDVGGNWWDLVSILADSRLIGREITRQRPVACLDCGGVLEIGPRNQLFCRFDGNRY